MKRTGIVKWFNAAKGYGFIAYGDEELFVHYSNVLIEGYKALMPAQLVEFNLSTGAKGKFAVEVKPLFS